MRFSSVSLLCATVLVALLCSTEARPDYGPDAGQRCHNEGEMFPENEFEHEDCDDEYYKCVNGRIRKYECSWGQVFDRDDKQCTHKFKCLFD